MSTNTIKPAKVKALPFFARFLDKQVAEQSGNAFDPLDYTLKYPSDKEDTL